MYRFLMKEQELYISLSIGGIGDTLASLPIVPFILDKHPHVKLTLWLKLSDLAIAKASLKKYTKTNRLAIHSYEDSSKAKLGVPVKKQDGSGHYTNLACHMTRQAFHCFVNTEPDDVNCYNYLPIDLRSVSIKRFNLPEKYWIIPVGYTAKVRQFLPETINKVAKFLSDSGYTPIFIGKKNTYTGNANEPILATLSDEIDYSLGIDMRNKMTILETALLIKESSGIVGLDNGMLHLAATTDIPIVGGFTTVKPEHRMPYRHGIMGWNYYPVVIPEGKLACNFCQSNMTLNFKHDFRNCFYNDYKCLEMLEADLYIEQIKKVIQK